MAASPMVPMNATGFTPEELVAIAIKLSDKAMGDEMFTSQDAMRYLTAKYGYSGTTDLTTEICRDIGMSVDQVRETLGRDDLLQQRTVVLADSGEVVERCKQMHREDTDAFTRAVEQHYLDTESEHNHQKAAIFNAMSHAYMRKLQDRKNRPYTFQKYSADVESDAE
eukprot:jgi/Tetstr1/454218/TSEL_041137.t1